MMTGKKRFKPMIAALMAVVLSLAMAGCTPSGQVSEGNEVPQTLDAAVSSALLGDEIKAGYAEGECAGEGHIILGSEETSEGEVKLYALTMTGNYGFINDNFEKVSGTGIIPAVLMFEYEDDVYTLQEIEFPLDGSLHESSLRAMFPAQYIGRVMSHDEADRAELEQQERAYAAAYLKEIGREAAIGNYRDFEHVLLTDLGISVEVSNRITEMKDLGAYPYWIGTREYLQDGVRYIYSMEYEQGADVITMKKYRASEKDRPIEHIEIDALTGTATVM